MINRLPIVRRPSKIVVGNGHRLAFFKDDPSILGFSMRIVLLVSRFIATGILHGIKRCFIETANDVFTVKLIRYFLRHVGIGPFNRHRRILLLFKNQALRGHYCPGPL